MLYIGHTFYQQCVWVVERGAAAVQQELALTHKGVHFREAFLMSYRVRSRHWHWAPSRVLRTCSRNSLMRRSLFAEHSGFSC